jgi:hypothetical protein
MTDRWRFVCHGEMGYMWHDQIYDRYVISDALGPAGIPGNGTKPRGSVKNEPAKFQNQEARGKHGSHPVFPVPQEARP